MIRHIPEGVVPFADCGYARMPCQPMTGDKVVLDCQCDAGEPRLEMPGMDNPPAPLRLQDRWRFELPAWNAACSVKYRFVCGEENSRWFEMDILKPVTVEAPIAAGEGWAKLYENVYLTAAQEENGIALYLADVMPAERACAELVFGEGGLWQLKCEGQPVLTCERMTLGLRADGSVAWQTAYLRGAHRRVYGTGERFDAVDQQGRGSCGQVVEHFTRQGQWSYLPVPAFLTDGGFGFYRAGDCSTGLNFDETICISSPWLPGMKDYLLTGTPAEQLGRYIRLTGEPVLPPEWAFGLWISANGWSNDAEVDEQLSQLKAHDCPAAVMVLEAWSDESTFYRWNDVWPDAETTVRRIREAGMHLVLWQIPVLKALKDCPDPESVRRDREEAIRKGYVVRHADGSPYVIPERWFEGSLLPDFTNPQACTWWFSQRDALLDMGVEGFKTDGGEFLFGSDMVLADGTSGQAAHNLYPMQYVRAYHEWMQRRGVQGVTFSRAGYAGAQTVPIHWAGDQLSTWEELQSQLRAGLSAGLSGVLFWGFDMGGFAGELPDAELYLRATAFGCFCPVMQWHAEPRSGQFYATHEADFNNDRSPWNLARKLNDPSLAQIACAFARLRESLRPYLYEEARYCAENGRPLMAHLCLDYPGDERALDCHNQYMLGRRYLVAPVVKAGAIGRRVYLPEGQWRNFFTGEVLPGGDHELPCPLDQAIVLEKIG